ncbi:MAG: hypothetical protein J6R68_05430 [Clostridia bacterium]|nr:hypothetical protein [Clostridia bacterium]
MAEFCLECQNKLDGTNYSKKKYILSNYLDLCEGCGCYKRVIIMEKKYYYLHKLRYVLFPFKIIGFLLRILIFPILLFIWITENKKDKYKE